MSMDTATVDPVTEPRKRPKRLWRVVFAALAIAVTVLLAALWLQPLPPRCELITADEYQRRTKRFAFIQDARAWMTRFSPKIFGFAPVHISAAHVGKEESDLLDPLPEPRYSSNGMRVWILTSNVVARVQRDMLPKSITRWRINTSDGTPSVISMGPGSGTLEFASHPKVRSGNVDLAAKLRLMSIIKSTGGFNERTNRETVFRMLLKRDEGAIILDESGVLFIWAYAPP